MKKSEIHPMPEYFGRYINLVEDIELKDAFKNSMDKINSLNLALFSKIGKQTYAPGKWTINEIIQHLSDSERILSYRTLLFAREDQTVPARFDEDLLARNSKANNKNISAIIDELKSVRQSTIALYNTFDTADLQKTGISWKDKISVLAMGFAMIGHQVHHLSFIETHYHQLADTVY